MWLGKLTSSCVLFSQYTEGCHTRPLRHGVTASVERKVGGGPHLAGKDIIGENAHTCIETPWYIGLFLTPSFILTPFLVT